MRVAEIPMAQRRGEAGYNLIELMVAVVVIAISVLALYEMFIQGSRMIREENHRSIAIQNAVSRMEKLKSFHVACDTVPKREAGHFTEYLVPEGEEGDEQPIEADIHVTVEHSRSRQANGRPNYSEVVVVYTWIEPVTGKRQRVEFQSYF